MSAAPMPSTTAHLRALFGRLPDHLFVATSYINADGEWRTACWSPAELDDAARWCAEHAGERNVYVRTTALSHRVPTWRRGTTDETGALVALWADLDVAGPGHAPAALPHPPNDAAVLEVLDELDTPPSMLVSTGGGLHGWWLLDEPWVFADDDDRLAAKRLAETWADGIVQRFARRGWCADKGVGDLARVLRVCGTWRRKPKCEPNRVTLHSCGAWPLGLVDEPLWRPGPLYTVAELAAAIDAGPKRATTATMATPDRAKRAATGRADKKYGPADAIRSLSWAEILEPAGWTLADHGTVAGEMVELWRRPRDPASAYSLKAWPDGVAINWSGASGLPVGVGLSKWDVFVALHWAGDGKAAGRAIRNRARELAA